jgi:ATP-dependent helicase YprA (DUF1998 family)
LTSLVEAIGLTASRELQIDEGELAGNWCPIPAGSRREVYLFLYDLLPGGAGYTRLVLQNLVDVVTATEGLLAGCTCESSCYRCLRHFGNNYLHASLDRHLALALLRHLLHGERPALPPEQERRALGPLVEFLRLKGLRSAVGVERAGQAIPLVVTRPGGGEIWVNIYHPLMDPEAANPEVQRLAESEMAEFCVLDSFTLIHDLPAAVAALQL